MYKLSPSDFAYLWEDCKHCYYQKIKNGIFLPSMPMPGVFSAINTRVQSKFVGKNLNSLAKDLPEGKVVIQEGWVESIVVPGTNVFIKGKYDLLVKNPDQTHTLVDLKISQPGEDKIEKYKTQLGAYKFALENPKVGEALKTTKLALLILYPDKVSFEKGVVELDFPHTWMEVPVDDAGFLNFIKEVDKLLAGEAPKESDTCAWCLYRKKFAPKKHSADDIPF
jgi:hypothetical protein